MEDTSRSPRNNPGERESDQGWLARFKHRLQTIRIVLVRENWYRDIWLLIITGIALYGVASIDSDVEKQREGRKIATEVLCGFNQAVVDAGRQTINNGGVIQPPEFERNLEKLGLPPRQARQRNAESAATAYALKINETIEKQAGVKGIVDPSTGSIDCKKLVQVARADDADRND